MREIVKVIRDDWYPNPDEEGRSIYKVEYRTGGYQYTASVFARDELAAAMYVMKQGAD